MLAAAEDRFGETPAVRDGETTLSYRALAAAARTFGAALVATGVEPGDRVAIWCPNCAEWVVAMLGTLAAGGVLVPVNTRFKGAEAAEILTRSGARVLVTVTDFLDTDYVAMLADTGARCRRWTRSSWPAVPLPPAAGGDRDAVSWEQFVGRATPGAHAEVRAAAPRWAPTTRRTSSSPRGRPACPRASS